MGCNDRTSNFQAFVYHDGKWWNSWGYEMTFTGPTKDIVEEGISTWSPGNAQDWEVTEQTDGSWKAAKVDNSGVASA